MIGDVPGEVDLDGGGDNRRHALWGLTILFLIAVLVIAITVFLGGGNKSPDGQHIQLGGPTDGVTATQTQPTQPATTSTKRHATKTATKHPTTSHTRRSSRAATMSDTTAAAPQTRSTPPSTSAPHIAGQPNNPCHSDDPCVVRGDAGVAKALNAARQAQGVAPANVLVTGSAQQCAAQVPDADCGAQSAQQNESGQDGGSAVTDLLASPDTAGWLLSSATTSLSVGWAFVPQIGGGEYLCVLIQASE